MRLSLFLPLVFLIPQSHANPLFDGFTADYEVSKNGTVLGISTRHLVSREQGQKLDYASTTIPKGLIALFVTDKFMEHSLIYVTPKGLRPQRYEFQRTGGKKEVTFQARFDWQKKLITMSSHPAPQPLLPNTQDLLSFQLALMQGLTKGQRQFDFHIVDHKRIQLQKLVYKKTVKMQSSIGSLDILQLQHQSAKSHYRFTFWCAKQLHFLPVKITKTEQDGDIIQLKLQQFNKKGVQLYDASPELNSDF